MTGIIITSILASSMQKVIETDTQIFMFFCCCCAGHKLETGISHTVYLNLNLNCLLVLHLLDNPSPGPEAQSLDPTKLVNL